MNRKFLIASGTIALSTLVPLESSWSDSAELPPEPASDAEQSIAVDREMGAVRAKAPQRKVIDEIIVTARKREENLQDVPLSIKALTGQELEEKGAKSFTEYADEVPSLQFSSIGSGQSRISLRGLQAPLGSAVVSYLLDDIPIQSTGTSPDNEIFDIESIQVLRGPQGTLYGSGAVGGTILVRTNAPRLEKFGTKFLSTVSYNEQGGADRDVNLMVNIPIIDNVFGARLVGFRRKSEGYITLREPDYAGPEPNHYSSENVVQPDANSKDIVGARIGLRYTPTDSLLITLRGSTQRSVLGLSTLVSPSMRERWGEFNASEGALGVTSSLLNYDNASLHIGWSLPWADFESITGYASNLTDSDLTVGVAIPPSSVFGADSFPPALIGAIDDNSTVYEIVDISQTRTHAFKTQEFRLVSATGSKLEYTVGVFGKVMQRDEPDTIVTDRGNLAGIANTNVRNFLREHHQIALFGEMAYQFNDKWGMALGYRDFHESISLDAEVVTNTSTTVYDEQGRWHRSSPKLGLNYRPRDEVLLYTVYGEGFRSGGFNIRDTNFETEGFKDTYDSDLLRSFEIGMNSEWLDRRLTVNAAVFYAGWDKVQMDLRLENEFGESQTLIYNLADASSKGIEWEATGLLGDSWRLSFGGSYLDARLDEDAPDPETGGVIPKGTPLENIPHWSLNLSAGYDHYFASGLALSTAGSLVYKGERHGCILIPDQCYTPSSTVVSLRTTLRGQGGRWDLTLFGNNLTDDLSPHVSFLIYDAIYRGPPRTVGLRFAYHGL